MATKAEKLLLQEFAAQFRSCAVCWWPEGDMRRRMEIHHLVGGAARKHVRENLLTLCSNCHAVLHSGSKVTGLPDLNKSILLAAKMEADPEYYNPQLLAKLKGKQHLGYEPESIPDVYLDQRKRNVRGWAFRNP